MFIQQRSFVKVLIFGILITFREKPTQGMIEEASGEYFHPGKKGIPKIQFLSVEQTNILPGKLR